jgi:hypothetical protein
MSQKELIQLKEHSDMYGAVGIYVYTDNRNKYLYDTSTGFTIQLAPIPTKTLMEWNKQNKKLKEQNNIKSCNCFVDPTIIKHIYL